MEPHRGIFWCCIVSISASQQDEVIRAICLSVTAANGSYVAECYSIQNRRLYCIHLPDDSDRRNWEVLTQADAGIINLILNAVEETVTACKSWELQFVLRNSDENGVYYVDKFDVPEQSPLENKSVVIGSDGVVKLQAYVSISYCAHHESYERKVFWSEQFGRVLAGEDVPQRFVIYSTMVERDKSDLAKSYGVDFRICDLLKPVVDEAVVERCKKLMMEEQESLYERTKPRSNSNSPQPSTPRQELGQASFSTIANTFAFREGKPRGNGLYAGLNYPKTLYGTERKKKMSEYKEKESDHCLLLLTKKRDKYSEAWARSLGRVMVLDTVFKGTEIRPGDWFYASVKLFPDLFRGVEPIYMVKKIVDLSAPLAFTECFMNEIKIEFDCSGQAIGNEGGTRIIYEDRLVGNITMSPEDYHRLHLMRMVCLLQFNHDTPCNKPWTLVRFLRELGAEEEFPVLSPECSISDKDRQRNRAQAAHQGLVGQNSRAFISGHDTEERDRGSEFSGPASRFGNSSTDLHHSVNRSPLLEEAVDIMENLLDSKAICDSIERRSPWLLARMHQFIASSRNGEGSSHRSTPYYESDNSSRTPNDERNGRGFHDREY